MRGGEITVDKNNDKLVYLKNNEAVCNSLQVAEKFEKRHNNIIRDINNLLKNELVKEMFMKSNYKDAKGESRLMYFMNRDGFSLLVMGFTGKQALEWKLQYIKAFNQMETFLREKCSVEWQETRSNGKSTRKVETYIIKEFVEYAKLNGSYHPEMYYKHYSDLANRAVGITDRENATIQQLNQLSMIENIIFHQIRLGMEQQQNYKEIYQNCRVQIETFKNIAYLGVFAR